MKYRVLIAIKTCHKYRQRADAQRRTWIPDVEGCDLKFFLGEKEGYQPLEDEVLLPVGDDYDSLPQKVVLICQWALERQYDFIFHADDDVYVRPERLLASGFESSDYVGRLRSPSGQWPAPYCSGFSYWLSAAGMRGVVKAQWNGDTADDRFVGNALQQAGLVGEFDARYRVTLTNQQAIAGKKGEFTREDIMVGNAVYGAGLTGRSDYRYRVVNSFPKMFQNIATGGEGPREGNEIISACEFEPAEMYAIHQQFLDARGTPRQMMPQGEFSNICVLIKTFLRDGYLEETVRGLRTRVPEMKMVIVDDGRDDQPSKVKLYQQLRDQGHVCIPMMFDSGFGAKANVGVTACDRPYVLIGSDDFNFDDNNIRLAIRRMLTVLEAAPSIGVASGRVDNNAYEFCWEMGDNWIKERKGYHSSAQVKGIWYQLCDLTVNFSLVRREVFEKVRWDDDVKIGGGEHGSFFLDVKRAGWKTCYVQGVNINQIKGKRDMHPKYLDYRARSQSPERPCYLRRGIEHYLNPAGVCEMCAETCMRVAQ